MRKCLDILMVLLLYGASVGVLADTFTPSHSCSEPRKPFQFDSEWELEEFRRDVEDCRECIIDFVDEQNEAITKHQNAAEDAIEDWEVFVDRELN